MIQFNKALTKTPARSLINGLTMVESDEKPDYTTAIAQHQQYIQALETAGLAVDTLAASEAFPDSCFVEDIAVLAPQFAVITRPGAQSRREEISENPTLMNPYFAPENIHTLTEPALLEGGDVMLIDQHFYVGLSTRTNAEGVAQLSQIAAAYGYTVSAVDVTYSLHLKTGVTYLGDNTLVMVDAYEKAPQFADFAKIITPSDEKNCANIIRINDHVLLPAGYAQTQAALDTRGYQTLPIAISEFEKIDGGLTCLSLRFNA